MARLAAPRRSRRPRRDPDHVRGRGRAPAARVGGGVAPGIPGFEAGAGRQRGGRTGAARCLWRGDDAMYQARRHNVGASLPAWELGRHVLGLLEQRWREPDEGIWEVRGGRRHFTHSKVMAWVAFDRGIKLCEEFGREGPLERWRAIR